MWVPLRLAASTLFKLPIRKLFIQVENTPNLNALKFKPGKKILEENQTAEYTSTSKEINSSPIARTLFKIDGVNGVLIGHDFVTITKNSTADWKHLKPIIFESLMNNFALDLPEKINTDINGTENDGADQVLLSMIRELLDTRIRPVIQEDGGDIQLKDFKDGIVYVKLMGSCRNCSSSTATLKQGVERMMTHYIPEVKAVEAVMDEIDIISTKALNDLEKEINDT